MMAALLACRSEEKRERKVSREMRNKGDWPRPLMAVFSISSTSLAKSSWREPKFEGVNHEGRERCINGFRVCIVFEVLGAPSPLDGLARCGRSAEMGRGKRADSCHVDGRHFPREDKLAVGDARAHILGLEACQDAV
jgi:hypothetical protein